MKTVYTIVHSIPGRIRLHIPALVDQKDHSNVEKAFINLQGIEFVTIQPITKTMMIKYNKSLLNNADVVRFIHLFFSVNASSLTIDQNRDVKKDFQHALLSGVLLMASYWRKNAAVNTNLLDYFMVAATTYTVSARSENKLTRPDMIKTLVSMFSSGTGGVLQSALVAYLLNFLQIAGSLKRQPQQSFVV